MEWEFATAARIVFGAGALRHAAPAARETGARALVVTGRSPARAQALASGLDAAGLAYAFFRITGEPTIDAVREGVERFRAGGCDFVIAVGGGSAIDAGKAIAALAVNPGSAADYLEVIGAGRPLEVAPAPFIAIPTTAGTGSEVTRNAVLASPEHRVKVSLRSPRMLARLAVVDPELTLDLPRAITASTGLDTLTQLIEPYVSTRANPMADGFCVEGIRRVARSLEPAFQNGHDHEARADMSLASLLSGLALANAALGIVHGIAAPVGGMYPAPHGAVCAAVLPHAMEANIRALRARAPESDAIGRYQAVARLLTGDPDADAEDGTVWVRDLCKKLQIPPLAVYGLAEGEVAEVAAKAARASSTKGNPVPLTAAEIHGIIECAQRG